MVYAEAVALDQSIFDAIATAADAAGVPLHVALGVAHVETGGTFNPRATSPVGAKGLFQLMPKTAADHGVTDPYDPAQSARAGLEFLATLTARYRGNLETALAAYNWGPANVKKKPSPEQWPESVRAYVANVSKHAARYREAVQRLPFVRPKKRPPYSGGGARTA